MNYIPDPSNRAPQDGYLSPSDADVFRAQLEPAYRHIGVAAIAHAAFEARMNQLLLTLESNGNPMPTSAGRSYLPTKNMEMSKKLSVLVESGDVENQLVEQLLKLQRAERELRNLRNSVVHSFISDPNPENPAQVYFEDARTELGPDRVRRTVEELWKATVQIADESAFLSAIAGEILGRIALSYLPESAKELPSVPTNSIDPDFAPKFEAFLKRGQWLGWSTTGLGLNPVHDEDWWLK